MERLVLSDAAWERIAPLIIGRPDQKGSTGRDNRMFVEGVLWIVRTGSPWRDLPEAFGDWNSVFRRFSPWSLVSAWDLAPTDADASVWLEDRYPLLSQYLRNSEGVLDVRIYGVSAQGGQLSKKSDGPGPDRERLLAIRPPSKRIRIAGPDVAEHDLTRPLLWLAGLEPPN